MTPVATRWILWAALLLALPVPYWAMEGGFVSTLWLVELAILTVAVLLTEGGSIVALITALFVGEAILASVVLWWAAGAAARLLHSRLPARWRTPGVATATLLLVASAFLRVNTTPLVAGGRPVNLLALFG